MKTSHLSLIHVSVDLMAGLACLRKVMARFKEFGSIISISSVYKKYRDQRFQDLNSQLVCVLKLETSFIFEDFFQEVVKSEEVLEKDSEGTVLTILTFDRVVRLFPGQNLPSPLLHSDSLVLRCASEIWGEYEHPVLGQTLDELVRYQSPLEQVEFFAQGVSLIQSESL